MSSKVSGISIIACRTLYWPFRPTQQMHEIIIVFFQHKCRISDVYMIIYGAVCQQGSHITPNSVTGRIIMAIAFIILMFLYVSYSANIVALLQSPSNQIQTLQDLYESKIDTFVEDTVYNRYYFPVSSVSRFTWSFINYFSFS